MPETAKDVARRIVEQSPEQATLDDIMYRLYVHQKLEAGLAAAEQGEVISHQQVKSRLLCGDD